MGLDMYLNARKFICGSEYRSEAEQDEFRRAWQAVNLNGPLNPDQLTGYVEFTIAYWRKANAIHQWFVVNVQDREDKCRPHHVDREKLEELMRLCERLLAEHKKNPEKAAELAAKELPPQAGFFFGGTEIDEYYWQDLKDTVNQLKRAARLPDEWEFQYQSSW